MLQGIRDRATSWVAWILIGLICAAFALTGLDGAANLLVGEDNVLEVGEQKYSKAGYDQTMSRFSNAGPYQKLQHLQGYAVRWTDTEWARKAGYGVDDKTWKALIRDNPNYQKNGEFDVELYKNDLATRDSGRTAAQNQASVKLSAATSQMQRGLIGSSFVVPAQVARFVELQKQTRTVQTAKLSAADYLAKQTASAEDITEYYTANKAKFFEPEQLQVDYVVLKLDDMKAKVTVNEEQIKALYAAQRGRFTNPNEQRLGAHILFLVDAEAGNDAEVKAKAETVLAEIKAGKSFADAAKEFSEDLPSKDTGGQLEWQKRADITDAAFDIALFDLKEKGDISAPVKTEFGYHLIKLVDAKDSSVQTYAEVKGQLEDEYRTNAAMEVFTEASENLGREAATDKTLEEIAKEHSVEVRTSALFSPTSTVGIAARPVVRNEAFTSLGDEEVQMGTLSSLATFEDAKGVATEAYLMSKKAFVARRQQEEAEVTKEITTLIKQQKAADQANQVAADINKALTEGKSVADVEESFKVKFTAANTIDRNQSGLLPSGIVSRIFAMDKPKAGAAEFGNFRDASAHYAVVLTNVAAGKVDALADVARDSLRSTLEQDRLRSDITSLRKAMQEELDYKLDLEKAGIDFGSNVTIK